MYVKKGGKFSSFLLSEEACASSAGVSDMRLNARNKVMPCAFQMRYFQFFKV